MKVPLLDLKAQFLSIEKEVRAAIERVLDTQHFIMGPEVTGLESEVAAFVGCSHGIGVSSGTDAILCALMALGVGPGDEIIVPTFTFFSTAGCVSRLRARPVFADIEPDTYNIDIKTLPKLITKKTRAIMPVHLFGACADMDAIMEMVKGTNIAVIEDAAQALSSKYKGRRAGCLGHVACFSFFPSKNLGGFGDGGMITTNDANLGEKCRLIRTHGSKPKYYHKIVGANFRLDALQAAVLRAKLPHLEAWSAARRRNAAVYDRLLAGAPVKTPVVRDFNETIYNQYCIRSTRRDALQQHLKQKEIGTEIYYPVPLHVQECFAELGYKPGSLPVSEEAARQVLALPIYPELTEEQIRYVADNVRGLA
ncbi:MAG TPA: DegT/DnrJ/EryC1/StrS family aminotransferase [Phycisphaerae bacterium]|nr:DegT/DnrJ/EryC1/StrS family aminotransferase [Phycisphaerae bacterium]